MKRTSKNINLKSHSNLIAAKLDEFKTINNLKLQKRRSKDYYEENRKKVALFSVSSARVAGYKDSKVLPITSKFMLEK